MLWDSTQGMKPVSTAKLETTEVTNDKDLVLEYVGEAVATKAELGGEKIISIFLQAEPQLQKHSLQQYMIMQVL